MGMFDRDEMDEEQFPWFLPYDEPVGEWDEEALRQYVEKELSDIFDCEGDNS